MTTDTENKEKEIADAPETQETNATEVKDEVKTEENKTEEGSEKSDSPPEAQNEDAQEEGEGSEYPVYESAAANAVVDTLKEYGVTPEQANDIFEDAVKSGDLSKIKLDKLVEKVGKSRADLILSGVTQYYNEVISTRDSLLKSISTEVGDGNWITIRDWAAEKQKTDKEFAKEIEPLIPLLTLNPKSAGMAARELRALYEKDPKNNSLKLKMIQGDSGSARTADRLTKEEYQRQVLKAVSKQDHAEVERLQTLRKISMRDGIR